MGRESNEPRTLADALAHELSEIQLPDPGHIRRARITKV
jgi:hypothetical protein